jgi:hypothetical protein
VKIFARDLTVTHRLRVAVLLGCCALQVCAESLGSGSAVIDYDAAVWNRLGGGISSPPVFVLKAFFEAPVAAAATAEELRTRADPHPSYIGQSYVMNGPVVLNHDGRTAQATTFRFSPGNPESATGVIGLGGVARFQMLGGSLAVGDFTLLYDASRIGTGGTGWILRSSIPTGTPSPLLFDLADVHAVASVSGFSIDGSLLVSPESAIGLFRTPSDAFRRAGSFRFDGFVAVPEPSTVALASAGLLLLIRASRRRS